ncbi:MAG: hypothetical protein HY423_10340 [Candidatus Lambdaproteobacteria bacterium]|nr:hypothetical protein [Candidatus Lambdaproteobacteria bacterium]
MNAFDLIPLVSNISDILKVSIGALIGFLGVYYTNRAIDRRNKIERRLEKLQSVVRTAYLLEEFLSHIDVLKWAEFNTNIVKIMGELGSIVNIYALELKNETDALKHECFVLTVTIMNASVRVSEQIKSMPNENPRAIFQRVIGEDVQPLSERVTKCADELIAKAGNEAQKLR